MEYRFREHKIVGGIGADDGYWEGLEEGHFRLSRCATCKTWIWPAHHRCAHCGAWELEWVDVEPRGTVYAWTRTHYLFDRMKGRAEDIPYVVVLAEIPEANGARVQGVLKGSEEGLRCGAPIVGTIDPPSEKSLGYPAIRWSLVRE